MFEKGICQNAHLPGSSQIQLLPRPTSPRRLSPSARGGVWVCFFKYLIGAVIGGGREEGGSPLTLRMLSSLGGCGLLVLVAVRRLWDLDSMISPHLEACCRVDGAWSCCSCLGGWWAVVQPLLRCL